MSGPAGHTGYTGVTGRCGLQGTPYGAPGTSFYSSSGRIPFVANTTLSPSSNIYITTPATYGTTYTITTTDFNQIIFAASMLASDVGVFWTFRNNTASTLLTISLSNATAVYNGSSAATSVKLAVGNSITFVYSGTGTSYIAI